MVDGARMKEGHLDLDSLQWSSGAHYIDWVAEGTEPSAQLIVHVVDPVSITAPSDGGTVAYEPESEGSNGFISDVVVANVTSDSQIVALEVVSAPVGWDAFLVSDPVLVLQPGESASCQVQVELMSTLGVTRNVKPVVVAARSVTVSLDEHGKPGLQDLVQSCEIQPWVKAADSEFEELEKQIGTALVL